MHPAFWGPHGWIFLHSITFAYPTNPSDEDKKHYFNLFNNLHHVLPCYQCSQHYENHLKKYPLTNKIMSDRHNLVEWLILIHNEVNISLNKPVVTTEEVIQIYNQKIHDTRYNNTYTEYIPYCVFIIIILVLVVLYIRK